MLRVLEHGADARRELARAPGDGIRAEAVGEGRLRDAPAGQRGQQAAERQRERALAAAVRTGEGGDAAGRERDADPVGDRGAARAAPADREAVRAEERRGRGTLPDGRGGLPSRPPDARGREGRTLVAQDVVRRAVGEDPAVRSEHDDPVDEVLPHGDPVLDDDEGGDAPLDHGLYGAPHLPDALGVEVGSRLVEEEEPGPHREDAGEGEALHLAAGERGGRAVEGDVEPDGVERGADADPDLVARDAQVLAAERDVVADAGEDHLRVRVLQHEPRAAAAGGRILRVDEQGAARLPLVVAAEDAREGVHERGLARTRRA